MGAFLRRIRTAAVCGALVAACIAVPVRASTPAVRGAGGRLVFVDEPQLVSTWADGTHRVEATIPGASYLADATVSPDGTRVAFSMGPSSLLAPGLEQIWVSPVDLSSPHRIASEAGKFLYEPTWSPDGKRLAYVSGYPVGYFGIGYQAQLWVMDADGSHRRLVAALPGAIEQPAWSPRGDQVAFVVDGQETGAMLDVVSVDKTVPRPAAITPLGMIGVSKPHWSPAGDRIAFETADLLATVRPDGSDLQQLAQGDNYPWDGGAVWSPDGHWLAFCRTNGGYFFGSSGTGPIVVAAGGGPERALGYSTCFYPAWSPDGASLAYVAQGQTHAAVLVTSFDGSATREMASAGGWLSWHDS